MSKALLICNGQKPGSWLKAYAKKVDFILAADGGANAACSIGIIPDAVIGDLDSISPRTRARLKHTSFIHVTRQDNTDLEKALDWLVKQGFEECILVGATGERLDFTLGNILAIRPYIKKINLSFLDKNWTLYPICHNFSLQTRPGVRLSLLPLTSCKEVTLKGCKYPLQQANLDGKNIGQTLSNLVCDSQVSLSLKSGYLLLYIEK